MFDIIHRGKLDFTLIRNSEAFNASDRFMDPSTEEGLDAIWFIMSMTAHVNMPMK